MHMVDYSFHFRALLVLFFPFGTTCSGYSDKMCPSFEAADRNFMRNRSYKKDDGIISLSMKSQKATEKIIRYLKNKVGCPST